VFGVPLVSFGNPLWADLNNDGYLDLISNRHNKPPKLYINDGQGGFQNRYDGSGLEPYERLDKHGFALGDYNNDGNVDLFLGTGGASGLLTPASRLLKGLGDGRFVDATDGSGLGGSGRASLWLDYDNDGWLDLIRKSPRSIFLHRNNGDGSFTDLTLEAGLTELNGSFTDTVSFADYDNDGDADFLIGGGPPLLLYDNDGAGKFRQVAFPGSDTGSARGVAWGDYDNDGDLDVAVSRGYPDYFGGTVVRPSKITFQNIIWDHESPKGLDFEITGGKVTFKLWHNSNWSDPESIFLGSTKGNPVSNPFTLSGAIGEADYTPGEVTGYFIWSDEVSDTWHVRWSNSSGILGFYGEIDLEEGQQVLDVNQSFPNYPMNFTVDLFRNNGDGTFARVTDEAGIAHIGQHRGGLIFGDYDNDGDLDLYAIDNGSIAGNSPNLLFQNNGDGTFEEVASLEGVEANDAVGRHYGAAWGDYDNDGYLDLALENGFGWGNPFAYGHDMLFRNLGGGNHWLKLSLHGSISNQSGLGSAVTIEAGGKRQMRYLNGGGGGEFYNQGSGPLHFGLGSARTVERLTVKWPSGTVQSYEDIPADQSLQIFEAPLPALGGKPAYVPGDSSDVFLWKNTFDGPYRLRVNGSGSYESVIVRLVSSSALVAVSPYNLEGDEEWFEGESGFSLRSEVFTFEDGVDFELQTGARALVAVQREGVANTRRLRVGEKETPLAPTGWILNVDELPVRPSFSGGRDLGLFVGRSSKTYDYIEARWSGNGMRHLGAVNLISSEPMLAVDGVALESHDWLQTTDTSVEAGGFVSTGWDGVQVAVMEPSLLGVAYEQDGLFPPLMVNSGEGSLGGPNAYWLPLALPYGAPSFDVHHDDRGAFLWKDNGGAWHLRAVSGSSGGYPRFTGRVVSDQPVEFVRAVALEQFDTLDVSDPTRLEFSLALMPGGLDGFDFQFPAGASISLDFDTPNTASEMLMVGEERWAVSRLPLDLSGW
jgi:hypothetical protein